MKLIVCGSRGIRSRDLVRETVRRSPFYREVTEVVHGGCRGVDEEAGKMAEDAGLKVTVFEADWESHGRGAGPIRNLAMADYVTMDGALVALWDGKSRGTRDMINKALDVGMDVYVRVIP